MAWALIKVNDSPDYAPETLSFNRVTLIPLVSTTQFEIPLPVCINKATCSPATGCTPEELANGFSFEQRLCMIKTVAVTGDNKHRS
jgi:hypothetical protein